MFFSDRAEYALITLYDDKAEELTRLLSGLIPDRDIKILTPRDRDTLIQAAQNSVLTFIRVEDESDPNFLLGQRLRDNRLVVCDIAAYCPAETDLTPVHAMARGFDALFTPADLHHPDFRKLLMARISAGNRRLGGLIHEIEYRRVCDALSHAPASMMIFDPDKRVVFVSDHYYRAYPNIAPKLIRGLSVYDAFDLMMREEGLRTDDTRFERLQKFWHNLEGSIEFTLDNGTTYRLKAVNLPSRGGTVLVGQNITDYHYRERKIEQQLTETRKELKFIQGDLEENSRLVRSLTRELRAHLNSLLSGREGKERRARPDLSALETLITSIEDSFRNKQ